MKKIDFKLIYPHLIAIVTFVLVALIYCKPALDGKVLQQTDITQWKAMYEDQRKYAELNGIENTPLWSNGMFSGMPGYQIGMYIPSPFSVGVIADSLVLGFPKPFSFFILACVCFYILTQILSINAYLGILGALSYSFATYNPILVAVGHETKMFAIAYMPAFVGSLILIYDKKYLLGLALTALFTGLMVSVNHLQITYYAFIIVGFMSLAYLVTFIKEKRYKHLFTSFGLAIVGILVGLTTCLVILATTMEYSKETIRGGSVLADSTSKNTKTGLSKDYALSYSFYKTEPLVMMFPMIYGGSSANLEVPQEKSKAIEVLQQMPQDLSRQIQGYLQFYWGGITSGTSGPPYSGAIICFLALLGFSVVPNKHKWWMIGVTVLTFMMSWGSYYEQFSVFLLDYLPYYNKFRAPSMIMVVPTFIFAMSAVIAAQQLLFEDALKGSLNKYKKGLYVVAGVFLLAILIYLTADFSTENDKNLISQVSQIQDVQQRDAILPQVKSFISALQDDRKGLLLSDFLRSFFYVSIAAAAIWLFIKKYIKASIALAIIGLFSLIDLFSIDTKYLSEKNFQDKEENDQTFVPALHNIEISKDTGYYRVFDLTQGVQSAFNGNNLSSAFHQSIGGYHAAKLSIYQDLIEKQLYKFPNCMPVINMLNTKYIIFTNQQTGQPTYQVNKDAAGSCWIVGAVRTEKNPSKVMSGLDNLKIKDTAIVEADLTMKIARNSGDSVWLVKNDHDRVYYQSNSSSSNNFAVFSEVYYKKGWKAFVDGKETPIYKTNYVLRGLEIPAGKHDIKFEFKPDSFYKTVPLASGANAVIWLLLIANLIPFGKKYYSRKKAQ
jgi:hypothetical protein